MLETINNWIISHANHAHWLIFGAILLAGCNLPISIDLILILAAVLAATTLADQAPHLFLAVYLGSFFSAWIAYWIGRLLGPKLTSIRFFDQLLAKKRLDSINNFYEKYGFLTLLIGRFIPFGVRNCLFLTSGIAKVHFGKFAARDSCACLIWAGLSFSFFYTLGHNYERLIVWMKTANLFIFLAFSVTAIGIIWYKKRKKNQRPDVY